MGSHTIQLQDQQLESKQPQPKQSRPIAKNQKAVSNEQ